MVCKLLSDQRDLSRLGVGEPTGQQLLLGRVENHGRRDDGILKLLLQPEINCVGRSARELLSGNDADQRLEVGFLWFWGFWLQVLDHYSKHWIRLG